MTVTKYSSFRFKGEKTPDYYLNCTIFFGKRGYRVGPERAPVKFGLCASPMVFLTGGLLWLLRPAILPGFVLNPMSFYKPINLFLIISA